MKVIGITGGVGSGKSEVLKLIDSLCSCRIVTADELARKLEEPGEVCFEPLVELLGRDILDENGSIDTKKMAATIFAKGNEGLVKKVNAIVHPAVKKRICSMIEEERKRGAADWFFIEAALLIEDHYDIIVDEMWYVFADENVRRQRLRHSRGYSEEKIDSIMAAQNSDEVFRKHCSTVIDNSAKLEDTRKQLVKILENE